MTRTVVVANAPDVLSAQIWTDALREAGIPARAFEHGPGAALGGAITTGVAVYPVLVAEEHFAEARAVIARLGGMQSLQPLEDREVEDARRWRSLAAVVGIALGAMALALAWQLASR